MKNNKIKLLAYCILISSCLFACSKSDSSGTNTGSETSGTGVGGSTARFTIIDNYMYTVDDEQLHIFDISNPTKPIEAGKYKVGTRIETIFSRDKNLFIGSQNGMYIFDASNPQLIDKKSLYTHIESCDPVVADSNYAYITLRSQGRRCGSTTNRLDIIDIKDLSKPQLIKSFNMEQPKGLGIDQKQLFVCDNGLKIYDVTDVTNIKLKHTFLISANDVIPYNGNLILIGDNALSQYSYANDTLKIISQINF